MDNIDKKREKILKVLDSIPLTHVITITFTKADGSERIISFTRRDSDRNVKGLKEGDKSHVLGASQRLHIHKNLLPVFSIEDDGFRQVNLDTVTRIETNKLEIHFE